MFLILVYLMGQWGCTTGRYGYPKPEPLSEEYRAQLGTIGVTTGKEVPVIELDTPPPPVITSTTPGFLARMGQGASDGAEKTGGWMWDTCKEGWTAPAGGNPGMGHVILGAGLAVWCILSVPVAILGGIGGFFYGALPPDEPPAPPAYVEPNEAILKNIGIVNLIDIPVPRSTWPSGAGLNTTTSFRFCYNTLFSGVSGPENAGTNYCSLRP